MESRGRIYLIDIVILYICIQNCLSTDCGKSCRNCSHITRCAPGITPVLDECGCCKICPKQLHEKCDTKSPCDVTKNLYCSYSELNSDEGICTATPGRSCYNDGNVYLNGQRFSRGSRYTCTCYDSDIMCKPTCPTTFRMMENCANPKWIRKAGKSCMELVCFKFRSHQKIVESSEAPELAQWPTPVTKRTAHGCLPQKSHWSPCSKSCGWGISYRYKTKKDGCKSTREIRLCKVANCRKSTMKMEFQQRKAKREIPKRRGIVGKAVRYSFLGCQSKIYFPRYCDASCSPKSTKTISVSFLCKNGKSFKKKMMQIKSCKCSKRNAI